MASQSDTPQNSVQLVHIGAVTRILNHSTYAVRGKVAFVFRDEDQNLRAVRLNSLHLPASPDASATAIDVVLHGRWQRACASVRKDNLLQIECAVVKTSRDLEVNSFQLELKDPIPSSQMGTPPKLYILSADMQPMSSVTYTTLSDGMVRSVAPQASSAPRSRSARVSIGESSRQYSYTPIAELWARTEGSRTVPSRGEKLNVYGVVIDCRAPCTTRGPDLRCEVVVADESSLLTGELKTMVIFCFEKKPSDCIPFRSTGDIIRAHRIHVGRYNDSNTGVSTVQGVGRFYSTFLLWSHEGTDFLPIASRDPVEVPSTGSSSTLNVTHVVTSQDRDKITLLRNWANSYLFRKHKVHRPYMRTVLEVTQAPPNADFLTRSFDLLCCVEGEAPLQLVEGNLKFIVSDGLFAPQDGGRRMRVESENSLDQLEHEPSSQFVDYCPSWEGKPHGASSWLLIRDVTIRTEGSNRVAVLSVNRRTSTIVWHPPNSPEVRTMKEKFRGARSTNHSSTPDVLQPPMEVLHAQRTVKRSSTITRENGSSSAPVERVRQTNGSGFQPEPLRATVTICKHPNEKVKISTIADIRNAIAERRFDPHRLKARARSCSVPRDLRLLCRPWCASCKKFMKIDTDHQLVECLWCSRTLRGNQGEEMQWAYCVCLTLEDASGGRLDAWIEGDQGSVFFRGSPPGNFVHKVDKRRELLKTFQRLLSPDCEMDCCIVPYEYEDTFGLYQVACKIFATELSQEASGNPTGG